MAQGLPFSPAVRVGHMVHLSGQLGTVPGTRQLVDTGIAAQTRQALDNVTAAPPPAGRAPRRALSRHALPARTHPHPPVNPHHARPLPERPPPLPPRPRRL